MRRLFWLAFLGFFLLSTAWTFAGPYNAALDENDHIIRAAGVASGQFAPEPAAAKAGSGAFQDVPAGIAVGDDPVPWCWAFKPDKSAACAPSPNGDRTVVHKPTGAGRYHPLYYAAVGLPLKLAPNWTGLYLARMISGAMSALLLAFAVVAIRRRLMFAAILAAVSPAVIHLSGSINPNGLEIAAGVLFFAAAIPLMDGDNRRSLIWSVGVSAILLAVLRPAGMAWLAVGVLTMVVWRRRRVVELLRIPLMRWMTLAVSLACATTLAWIVWKKATYLGNYSSGHISVGRALLTEAERWRMYLDQMVGTLGWNDVKPPAPAYLIWQLMAGSLVVWALLFAQKGDRVRLVLLFGGAVILPSALQVYYVNTMGFVTHGRYMLPLAAGLLLLSAWVLDEHAPPRAARGFALVLLPIQLLFLVWGMARWQHGITGTLNDLNPLTGSWLPPLGPVLPLLLGLAGVVTLGVLIGQATQDAGLRVHAR